MRQLLTPVLALHWMMVFALAAGLLALGGSGGVGAMFALMGVALHDGSLLAPLGAAVPLALSVGFALVAVLFLWAALDGVFGAERRADDGREVVLIAFSGAVAMLTVVLAFGVTLPVSGLARATMTGVVALLLSFLAIAAEGWIARTRQRDNADPHAQARMQEQIQAMTADAVHKLHLSRIAGRIADRAPGDET